MNYYVIDYIKDINNIYETTKGINKCISLCNENGGGNIIFSSNYTFNSGMIILKDNINLHFEENSELKVCNDLALFDINGDPSYNKLNTPTWENCDYSGSPTKFFIYAYNCKNISITGKGIINGNDEIFYGNVTKWHIDGKFYPRIPLIFFENCSNISINDITIKNSGFWTIHLVGCENINIDNIKIYNSLKLACCDGIDPDHCKNVKIKNCYIESADDCIVFKATSNAKKYGECKNIEVSNCTLMSTSAAIKFGTESVSNFENIYIHDCNIIKSNRGISFQLRDEGNIKNIKFENINIETRRFSPIHWWGKAEPINITAVKRTENTNIGVIDNITFNNIKCDSENGIFIYGEDIININNIYLNNIEIKIKSKTDWEKNTHDLRPSYNLGIIENPLNVLYSKNVNNLSLSNITYNIDDSIKNECGNVYELIKTQIIK